MFAFAFALALLAACLPACLLACWLAGWLALSIARSLARSLACLFVRSCLLARLPACSLACLLACSFACLLACSLARLLACLLALACLPARGLFLGLFSGLCNPSLTWGLAKCTSKSRGHLEFVCLLLWVSGSDFRAVFPMNLIIQMLPEAHVWASLVLP